MEFMSWDRTYKQTYKRDYNFFIYRYSSSNTSAPLTILAKCHQLKAML